jgi:hypothetical protein
MAVAAIHADMRRMARTAAACRRLASLNRSRLSLRASADLDYVGSISASQYHPPPYVRPGLPR